MSTTVFGVVVALVGLSLVVRGYATIRAIISLFGALVGFVVGAYVVAQATRSALFENQAGWISAAIGAVVCGLLAYLSYQVGIILGMASIGWTLGASLAVALRVDSRWASLVASLLCAVVLAVIAVKLDLPGLILVILTVLAGASVTVVGTMLAMGALTFRTLTQAHLTRAVADGWGWYALYVGLLALGLVSQWRYLKVRTAVRGRWGRG